eukprot:Colp12_sorted_trinity150504_noHs@22461
MATAGVHAPLPPSRDCSRVASTPLHEAARSGDLDTCKLLIGQGANVRARDEDGNTPLHVALEHVDVCTLLLERGAEVDARNNIENTPLFQAAKLQYYETFKLLAGHCMACSNFPLLKALLFHAITTAEVGIVRFVVEIYPDCANATDCDGELPLHAAVKTRNLRICACLLACGADPNKCHYSDRSALHVAAENKDTEISRLLIDHGADLNKRDSFPGATPLHIAVFTENYSLCLLLLENGADPNICDEQRHTPLYEAARFGEARICELLLDYGADPNREGYKPLSVAVEGGKISISGLLLERGADPNEDKGKPLCVAAEKGNTGICALLLEYGADPNLGGSALRALENSHFETCAFLLNKGADPTTCDSNGDTLLVSAFIASYNLTVKAFNSPHNSEKSLIADEYASDIAKFTALISLMLEKGANPNLPQSGCRKTPLHHAAIMSPDMCRLLLEKGADPHARDSEGDTPLHIAAFWGNLEVCELLIEKGADTTVCNKVGGTPLHAAAEKQRTEICALLLRYNADVNVCDNKEGATPLHNAARQCEIEDWIRLIKDGTMVVESDQKRREFLRRMASECKLDTCKLLVEWGADLDARDKQGDTPLLIAAKNLLEELCVQLLNSGSRADAQNN